MYPLPTPQDPSLINSSTSYVPNICNINNHVEWQKLDILTIYFLLLVTNFNTFYYYVSNSIFSNELFYYLSTYPLETTEIPHLIRVPMVKNHCFRLFRPHFANTFAISICTFISWQYVNVVIIACCADSKWAKIIIYAGLKRQYTVDDRKKQRN